MGTYGLSCSNCHWQSQDFNTEIKNPSFDKTMNLKSNMLLNEKKSDIRVIFLLIKLIEVRILL